MSMYVPATLVQPAAALAPVGIVSTSSPIGRPARASISVTSTRLDVLDGQAAIVTGSLRPALAGRMVIMQTLGRRGWSTVAHARTRAKGGFQLRFLAHRTGSERVRVRFAGDALDLGTHRRLGWLNVYRLAGASWYGGGGGLACGGSLTEATMGVANKTLPCGTLVTLRYGGRSVRVPVIDRGPYVAGREFDLTAATKQALGFGDTGELWSTR
jgi:rare lipoprotein A